MKPNLFYAIVKGMGARIITAFLCLIALLVELTIDSSTGFVRQHPPTPVGKLVVVQDKSIDQTLSVPLISDASSDSPSLPHSDQNEGGSDLFHLDSAPSHAGQVATRIVFPIFLSVSRYIPDIDPFSIHHPVSELERPPTT